MITFDNIYDHAAACTLYADAPVPSRTGRYRRIITEVSFILSNGHVLTIKPGFEWDEASVPWLLQPLYPKSGIYARSSLVQDAPTTMLHTQEFGWNGSFTAGCLQVV